VRQIEHANSFERSGEEAGGGVPEHGLIILLPTSQGMGVFSGALSTDEPRPADETTPGTIETVRRIVG
jgi:hypothetical protein